MPRADPDIDSAPRITLDVGPLLSLYSIPDVLQLHTRSLSAKSVFLKGLLSGISPLDLVHDLSTSRLRPSIPLRIPHSRLPRLLPSPPSHPVLFLPVPDPSSIQPLFHWMYSGNTDHIESALDEGLIQWQGLVRNVEYLCLSTDIKVFLGRWYRNWLLPAHANPCPPDDDDPSDLDSDGQDSDSIHCYSSPSTDDECQSDDDECNRGRAIDIKPLVQSCAQLRLCTA